MRCLPVPHPWIPAQGRNDELRAVLVGHFHANDQGVARGRMTKRWRGNEENELEKNGGPRRTELRTFRWEVQI